MPAAAIGAAASIGGGLIASSAAKKAAKTQAASQQAALDAQERMFEKQTALQEPFRQGGMTAQNRLMTLLGLAPPAPSTPTGGTAARTVSGPFGNITIPGTATGQSVNAQGIVVDPNDPDFGKYARDFSMQDFEQDPGYAFRLSEGQKALDRSAAARGGLQSGAALKAAARYGQDMGSQEYQNAFNRYQINRSNQLNPLQSLMGSGQSATNTMTNAAGNYGNQMAEGLTNIGAARASGYVGSANALTGALGQGLNFYQNQQYLNQMNNPGMSLNSMPYSSGSSLPYSGFNVPIGG